MVNLPADIKTLRSEQHSENHHLIMEKFKTVLPDINNYKREQLHELTTAV